MFIYNSGVDNRWVDSQKYTLSKNYSSDNVNQMKNQPLCSGCDIHEAGVSVDLSTPLAGYTSHTLNPSDIYYLHLLPTEKNNMHKWLY
jgi:hypothetical protein